MTQLSWHDIRGQSMWPLGAPFQAGVAPVTLHQLQPGDVVAFIAAHAPVLWVHRVVRVEAEALVTRGDTNRQDDPPVPFAAVLGRVEALRLGQIVVALPHSGPLARLHRQAGLAWSRVAPPLRRTYAKAKSVRKGQ